MSADGGSTLGFTSSGLTLSLERPSSVGIDAFIARGGSVDGRDGARKHSSARPEKNASARRLRPAGDPLPLHFDGELNRERRLEGSGEGNRPPPFSKAQEWYFTNEEYIKIAIKSEPLFDTCARLHSFLHQYF